MMLKKILADSLGYSIFSGIAACVSIISLPLYDEILVADDFGKLAIYQTFVLIAGPLVGLGVNTLLRKELVASGGNDQLAISHSFVIPVMSGTTLLLLTIVCTPLFVQYGILKDYFIPLFGALTVVFNTFVSYASSVLQARKKIALHGVVTVFVPILSNAIGLFLVYFVLNDWHSRIYGFLLGTGMVAFGSVLYVFKSESVNFIWNKIETVKRLQRGVKVLPQGIMSYILRRTDLIMIGALTTMYAAAQYSMAISVISLIMLFFGAIQRAFEVYWYEALDNKNAVDTGMMFSLYLRLLVVLSVIALVFSMLGAEAILFFLDSDLHASIKYIPYLAISAMFQVLQGCLSLSLIYYDRLGSFAYIFTGAAFVNVVLNAALIPVFGALGAAYSTLLVSSASFLVQLYLVRNCMKAVRG